MRRYRHDSGKLHKHKKFKSIYVGPRIKVGDIFENCRYYPVIATEVDGDDVTGVDLFSGRITFCSRRNCIVKVLSPKEVGIKLQLKSKWIKAYNAYQSGFNSDVYRDVKTAEDILHNNTPTLSA